MDYVRLKYVMVCRSFKVTSSLYVLMLIYLLLPIWLVLQEIYSIKLPGNPKLGEGKPENQNHAIVFTRGNAVQTIDMNQVLIVSFGTCFPFEMPTK